MGFDGDVIKSHDVTGIQLHGYHGYSRENGDITNKMVMFHEI